MDVSAHACEGAAILSDLGSSISQMAAHPSNRFTAQRRRLGPMHRWGWHALAESH